MLIWCLQLVLVVGNLPLLRVLVPLHRCVVRTAPVVVGRPHTGGIALAADGLLWGLFLLTTHFRMQCGVRLCCDLARDTKACVRQSQQREKLQLPPPYGRLSQTRASRSDLDLVGKGECCSVQPSHTLLVAMTPLLQHVALLPVLAAALLASVTAGRNGGGPVAPALLQPTTQVRCAPTHTATYLRRKDCCC